MGTHGFTVYRYRKAYFIYDRSGAHPSELGVELLQSMQRPNAIADQRLEMERILRLHIERRLSAEEAPYLVTKTRPIIADIYFDWIYEIDLDRRIFHINGIPFYSLECLPNDEDFLKYMSRDYYGNIACGRRCPSEHTCKRPAPPVVDDSDLATYKLLECRGTHLAVSDILHISDILSPDERVRVSLLETMIGHCRRHIASMIYDISLAFDHRQFTDEQWSIACYMANFAFIPQMFDSSYGWIYHPKLERKEFTWVREDTVVYIASHLDDERCLQASLSRLINAIMEQKDNPGEYFGIAFSVLHCAVVKVVKDAHTTTFSHTATLPFLPSSYANSPSMPGITALARLGYRVDPALFFRVAKICLWLGPRLGPRLGVWSTNKKKPLAEGTDDTPPSINCAELPVELWREIALHLHVRDLVTFGLVSKLCREVASMILRYPHVSCYRLVHVPKRKSYRLQHNRYFLHAASFCAVREGIPAMAFVGWGTKSGTVKMPLHLDESSNYSPASYIRFTAEEYVHANATKKTLTAD